MKKIKKYVYLVYLQLHIYITHIKKITVELESLFENENDYKNQRKNKPSTENIFILFRFFFLCDNAKKNDFNAFRLI